MSIEAMKLALEALNEWRVEWSADFYEEKYDSDEPEENTRRTLVKSAITALSQAIEQAQKQEPVAFVDTDPIDLQLYPPQRQPLTDEQIAQCMISVDDPIRWGKLGAGCEPMVKQFTRAIEAAHGIKGEA